MEAKKRIWTGSFFSIFFIGFAATMISEALQSALPVYIEEMHYSGTLCGLLISTFGFFAAVTPVIAGSLADCYGCRRLMIYGALFYATGTLIGLIIPEITLLFIGRVLQGIGFGILNVTASSGAANILPREKIGTGLAYYGISKALAMALGPILGLITLAKSGRTMWLFLFITAIIVLILSIFCNCDVTSSENKAAPMRFSWKTIFEKKAFLPSIMILIFCMGISLLISYSGIYAKQNNFIKSAKIFFMCSGISMILIRGFSGLFMDRFKTLTILLPTMLLGSIPFIILAFFPSEIPFRIAGVMYGISFGIAMPLLATYGIKNVTPERRGACNATFYFSVTLGFAFGAIAGGIGIDSIGITNTFLLGTLSTLIPALIGICFLPRSEN